MKEGKILRTLVCSNVIYDITNPEAIRKDWKRCRKIIEQEKHFQETWAFLKKDMNMTWEGAYDGPVLLPLLPTKVNYIDK